MSVLGQRKIDVQIGDGSFRQHDRAHSSRSLNGGCLHDRSKDNNSVALAGCGERKPEQPSKVFEQNDVLDKGILNAKRICEFQHGGISQQNTTGRSCDNLSCRATVDLAKNESNQLVAVVFPQVSSAVLNLPQRQFGPVVSFGSGWRPAMVQGVAA